MKSTASEPDLTTSTRLIFRAFQQKCPKQTNDQGIIVDKEKSEKG